MSNDRPTVPSVSSAQMAGTALENGHRRNLSAFGTRAQASISRPDMLHGATNGSNGNGNASQQVP
ncbi:hypothetical protein GGI11_008843, partial [Coemansia sp. RSA 2049]